MFATNKIAILLMNTGSPESPSLFHVASYLSRFLGNKHVISLPWLPRMLLVNGIIVPFRSLRSSARYRKLWNRFGKQQFPLPYYMERVREILQKKTGEDTTVFLGQCYGKPGIQEQVKSIVQNGYERLILLPMFPQYAESSSEVALEMAEQALKKYPNRLAVETMYSFYKHPAFIKAWADKIRQCQPESFDRIVFTFHSIPISQVRKAALLHDYPAACEETSRRIAEALCLSNEQWEVTYQSQMRGDWLQPYLNQRLTTLPGEGCNRVLLVPASFVADCLETTLELEEECKLLFLSNGGEKYEVVECLNEELPIFAILYQNK